MDWRIIDSYTAEYNNAIASGQIQRAYTLALEMISLYEKRGDLAQSCAWYRALSTSLYYQGLYNEATEKAEQAIELYLDPYERAYLYIRLASMHKLNAKYYSAFKCLGKAEEIAELFGKRSRLITKLHECRGFLLQGTGDLDQAIVEEEIAARLCLNNGWFSDAAVLINNIGFYTAKPTKTIEAEKQLIYALELLRKEPHLHTEAAVYDSLGFVYSLKGCQSQAEKLLAKSVRLFEAISDKGQLIGSLIHLSQLYERMRRWKQARSEAERALTLATEINSESLCAEARNQLDSIEAIIVKIIDKPRLFHDILYLSSKMQSVIINLKKIAVTSEVALLLGETGTGKELAARAIHQESHRRNKPFIPFNCSALSRELIESRLFGHRRGAFTGADRDHQGVIRASAGGTIFLDEIGDLSLEAQGALLRFLQTGEIQPVGASIPLKIDVRVIAATNRDLREEVEAGRFRRDLYYRLNVGTLLLPPLRLRREDITALARHFADLYSKQFGLPAIELSRAEIASLSAYDWPGNVRELEGFIKRRVLFGPETALFESDLTRIPSWRKLREAEKRKFLLESLEQNDSNVTATARQLGLSRRTVQKILQRIKEEAS